MLNVKQGDCEKINLFFDLTRPDMESATNVLFTWPLIAVAYV